MRSAPPSGHIKRTLAAFCAAVAGFCAATAAVEPGQSPPNAAPTPGASTLGQAVEAIGLHGGLCVQIGAEATDSVAELAGTGRFLIQVLDRDQALVDEARQRLHASGRYGLASVGRLPNEGVLPYTENLVDLLFVGPRDSANVSLGEVERVLCPGGSLVIESKKQSAQALEAAGWVDIRTIGPNGTWLAATKAPSAEADEWSHPRHSASGNAVSQDGLVAPPRRVRWVVGAEAEVRGMVTAAGRNFYAGVLARSGYNGLRLWHRDLVTASTPDDYTMKNLGRGQAQPVSDGKHLYVVENTLVALDAATGRPVREYPEAGKPNTVLFDQGTLFAVTADSVRAFYAESGELRWTFAASAPRYVVAGDDTVALIHGQPQRGERLEAVVLDAATGKVRWQRGDFPWLQDVRQAVYHQGMVTFEVSSLNDNGPGNAIHILSAADGETRLDYPFFPGMNHRRQARPMFLGDRLWLLHGGRDADGKKGPVQVSAIDIATAKMLTTHPAGLTHCFPPVMTRRFMISGEFDLTNLETGQVDAHQITKAACGPDGGWVPANGLIYVTPKHCVCWPMLRGYAALAPKRAAGDVAEMDVAQIDFPLETGVDPPSPSEASEADWPCYRHDAWRSGSTPATAPSKFKPLWSTDLAGDDVSGPVVDDWEENPFVKGPITSPVVAGGRVVVARPDAHEVVALDAADGSVAWRFTAGGRVDTPPTLHAGLCLFGAKNGWVYCLRADDGRLVWRLRAAPLHEQIVAYGQLESPWPVPGSVLVVEGVAYFAAGRQSLADGGILIFAVDPPTGKIGWVRRLDSVPQEGFYECSGLEFDNFDLLHREANGVGMSRWVFDRETGQMSLDRWTAFAQLNTGTGSAIVPRGCWSYAPRHQRRIPSFTHRRPLAVYRGQTLIGTLQGSSTIYRRDFEPGGEAFKTKWITGWAASGLSREGKMPWPSHRLAEKAMWKTDPFGKEKAPPIDAMLLAADRLLLAGADGRFTMVSTTDGKPLAKQTLPPPLWDGLALANGRLYYATREGQILCLGE